METIQSVVSHHAAASTVHQVALGNIRTGMNPRKYFDPKEMDELIESVRAQGILQPVLLRKQEDGLVIVAGERRYRAALAVYGDSGTIPADIRTMTDAETMAAALAENKHRACVSPTEESDEAARLVAELDGNREEAARQLGWPRSTLDRRLALQHCTETVKTALNERKILVGHAELLAVAPKDSQDAVLAGVIAKNITVEALKSMLTGKTKKLASACFDQAECKSCHHNSDHQLSLLDTNVGAGYCTNWSCFDRKTGEFVQVIVDQLAEDVPNVRVIEPGDIRKTILLKVEGTGAVGTEQFESGCKGCQHYGATVSKIPGEEGKVERSRCFDIVCNTQKQAAYIASQQPAAPEQPAAPTKAQPASAGASAKPKTATAAKPKVSASAIPPRVEEHRTEVFRSLIKKAVMSNGDAAQSVLFSLVMEGDYRHISETKIKGQWAKIYGVALPNDLHGLLKHFASLDAEKRDVTNRAMAATIINSIEKRKLPVLMDFLSIDMSQSWSLSDKYLQLLTKSEMEALAAEIGLKAHMGKDFAKLMNSKRDEIIKQFLSVAGFTFAGLVPKAMDYKALLPKTKSESDEL